jgi:hypothetical protein
MVLLGMYVCGVWFAMVATGNLAASDVEDCDQTGQGDRLSIEARRVDVKLENC